MKQYVKQWNGLLGGLVFLVLSLSCSKKDTEPQDSDPIQGGIGTRDTKFDGVYIARDPRLNPSLPDHRYIEFDAWFARRKNGHIFESNTLSLIVNSAQGKVRVKTDFLPSGSSIPGLSSTQHPRLLYVEVDSRKIYFNYYTQDQSHRALHTDNVHGNSVEPWRNERNYWIIHDLSTNNDFKYVALESAFERGWYIMNESTLNGDTRIRLMQRNSPSQATKWEIHNP